MSTFFLVFMITVVFTCVYRIFALNRQLLDIPNARSSHSMPVPRGGGVAIAVVVVAFIGLSNTMTVLSDGLLPFLIGLCSVTLIGFLDDKGHVSVPVRLLVHMFSCGCIAWGMWTTNSNLTLLGFQIEMNIGIFAVVILGLVWLLNLFNFMDGINGIATSEAAVTVSAAALLLHIGNYDESAVGTLLTIHWIFAASCLGFLVWNFPIARIFLGDSGSGFIGLFLGGLIIEAYLVDESLLWSWLILLGVFVVDATYTLIRRLIAKEKIYEAHRCHAYQHAAQYYQSHTKVTVTIIIINTAWLFPMAALVAIDMLNGVIALCIAYMPLVFMAHYFGAGKKVAKLV